MKRPRKLPRNINWEAYVNTASIDLRKMNDELQSVESFTQERVDQVITDLNDVITKSARCCEIKDSASAPTPQIQENLTLEQIKAGISKKEIDSWNEILESGDPGDLWNKIN